MHVPSVYTVVATEGIASQAAACLSTVTTPALVAALSPGIGSQVRAATEHNGSTDLESGGPPVVEAVPRSRSANLGVVVRP
jgi:hypothetical protein